MDGHRSRKVEISVDFTTALISCLIGKRKIKRVPVKTSGNALPSLEHYFKPGLTWPLAASVFNVRWMPPGCVFGHKGPAIFP